MNDVLIVDDDPAMRDFLRLVLTRAKLTCRVAGDGVRAIRLARERWPALILLDLALPGGLDGWQVWDSLTAYAAGRELNVIVFAGELSWADRDRAHRLGAIEILHKPVQLAELFNALANVFR